MKNEREEIWLVKSDNVLLGPFSEARVVEGIRSREFRAIDEALSPEGRWLYIRQIPIFTKAVDEARHGVRTSMDDTTRDMMSSTMSQTMNLTETDLTDDRTEEISASVIQEAMFQSYDDSSRGRDRRNVPVASQYTYEGDPTVQQAAKVSTRWVMVLTVCLIFITVGYVVFNRFVARPIQTQSKVEENMTVAYESIDLGDFVTALEKFRAVREANPDDKGIHTQLALLEIQVGQQPVVGRRILEGLRSWAGAERKMISMGLGLASLRENDYAAAATQFQDALNADALLLPAEINLGVTSLYQKDFPGASGYFQLAIKDGSKDGIEAVLLVQALVNLWKAESDRSFLIEAKKFVDQSTTSEGPYLDQLLVAGAYISVKLDFKDDAELYFKRFADRSMVEGERYRLDLQVHRDQVSWATFNQWCLEGARALEPKSWLIAVESKCLAKMGDLMGASGRIEQAVEQTPRDGLVQAIYGDLLTKMNSNERAKVAGEKAIDFDKAEQYQLPRMLQAEVCQNSKDYTCAEKYWSWVQQKNPSSMAAISGLAFSYFSEGRYEEARRYVTMGKRLHSNYMPLLRLQKSLARIDQKRGP